MNMKQIVAWLLSVLLLLGGAFAETKITVTGNGTEYVSADTAVIELGVRTTDRQVLTAQARANTAIAAIREKLKAFGLKENDLVTGNLSIYSENDSLGTVKYSVYSTLTVYVEDVTTAGTVIDLAFEAGANSLNGISFQANDTAEAEETALRAAVADAVKTADLLADAAGLKVTGIEEMIKNASFSYGSDVVNNRYAMAKEEPAGDTVIRANKICVTVSVTMVFSAK